MFQNVNFREVSRACMIEQMTWETVIYGNTVAIMKFRSTWNVPWSCIMVTIRSRPVNCPNRNFCPNGIADKNYYFSCPMSEWLKNNYFFCPMSEWSRAGHLFFLSEWADQIGIGWAAPVGVAWVDPSVDRPDRSTNVFFCGWDVLWGHCY